MKITEEKIHRESKMKQDIKKQIAILRKGNTEVRLYEEYDGTWFADETTMNKNRKGSSIKANLSYFEDGMDEDRIIKRYEIKGFKTILRVKRKD